MEQQQLRFRIGFTIVELVIAIAVIGLLASITVVSYTGWRKQVAETEVKSDLNSIKSALESSRNFGNIYPSAIPATFTPSAGVEVVSYTSDGTTYCAITKSKKVTTVVYAMKTGKDPVKASTCTGL